MVGQLYPKGATKEERRKCVSMVGTPPCICWFIDLLLIVLYPTNEELLVWLFIVHVLNSFGSYLAHSRPDFDDSDDGGKLFRYACLVLGWFLHGGGAPALISSPALTCLPSGVTMTLRAPTTTKNASQGNGTLLQQQRSVAVALQAPPSVCVCNGTETPLCTVLLPGEAAQHPPIYFLAAYSCRGGGGLARAVCATNPV